MPTSYFEDGRLTLKTVNVVTSDLYHTNSFLAQMVLQLNVLNKKAQAKMTQKLQKRQNEENEFFFW